MALVVWARLIQEVYEVAPLIGPHCGGEMRFLSEKHSILFLPKNERTEQKRVGRYEY